MILSLFACGDPELQFDISPSPLDLGVVDDDSALTHTGLQLTMNAMAPQ